MSCLTECSQPRHQSTEGMWHLYRLESQGFSPPDVGTEGPFSMTDQASWTNLIKRPTSLISKKSLTFEKTVTIDAGSFFFFFFLWEWWLLNKSGHKAPALQHNKTICFSGRVSYIIYEATKCWLLSVKRLHGAGARKAALLYVMQWGSNHQQPPRMLLFIHNTTGHNWTPYPSQARWVLLIIQSINLM